MKFLSPLLVLVICFITGVVMAAQAKDYELVQCRDFKFSNYNSTINKTRSEEHMNFNWQEDNCHIFATKINLLKDYSKTAAIVDKGLLVIVYVKYKKVMVCFPGVPMTAKNNIHCYALK